MRTDLQILCNALINYEEHYGPFHWKVARTLTQMALFHINEGALDKNDQEVRRLLLRAVAIYRKEAWECWCQTLQSNRLYRDICLYFLASMQHFFGNPIIAERLQSQLHVAKKYSRNHFWPQVNNNMNGLTTHDLFSYLRSLHNTLNRLYQHPNQTNHPQLSKKIEAVVFPLEVALGNQHVIKWFQALYRYEQAGSVSHVTRLWSKHISLEQKTIRPCVFSMKH